MKNEKGFSLVEVLTIVVVLAIIMSIAVPRVLVSIDNVRKETFRKGANSIVDTVKLEYSQKYKKDEKAITYSFLDGGYASNSPQLKLKGDLPQSGSVYLGVDGKIALAVRSPDGKYCAKKKLNEAEVTVEKFELDSCKVDTPKGPIGVVHSVTIDYDDNKAGWTNVNRTIKIRSTSSLDDEANSKYLTTIEYQFSTNGKKYDDKWITYDRTSEGVKVSENGTLFARLVYIDEDTKDEIHLASANKIGFKIDTTSPKCSFKLTKTNDKQITKTTYKTTDWYNENVKVSVNAEDTESGINSKKTIINNTVNSNNYIIVTNDGSTKVSAIVFDNAGNFTNCGTITINKDSKKPSCNVIVRRTTDLVEGNNQWYKSNVSLIVEGNSEISSIQSTGISTSNSKNYTTPNLTITQDGSVTVYGFVKSTSGLEGTCSKVIKKDSTPPTCSYSGEGTTWTKNNRKITTQCNDSTNSTNSTSGCVTSSFYNIFNKTTKTGSVSHTISDNAGNTTNCSKTANVYVDKTKPTLGSATFTNLAQASYKMTITGSDNHSGVANYSYSVKGGNSKSNTTSTSFSANKVDQITVKILDKAGNSNSKNYTLNAIDAYIRQLYRGMAGREPDTNGLNYWKTEYKNFLKVNGGKSINDIVLGIFLSSEATSNLNTNTKFVNAVYTGVLGRNADAGGLDSFVKKLNNGTSRKDVLNQIMSTTEFKALVKFYNFAESVSYTPSTYAATTNYTCPDYWNFDGANTCSTVESYACTVPCQAWTSSWNRIETGTSSFFLNRTCPDSNNEVKPYNSSIKWGGCTGYNCGSMGTAYTYCKYKYEKVYSLVNTTCNSTCERTLTQNVSITYSCDDNATLKGTTCYYCPKGGNYNSSTNKCVIE